jgi:hypothetical protein
VGLALLLPLILSACSEGGDTTNAEGTLLKRPFEEGHEVEEGPFSSRSIPRSFKPILCRRKRNMQKGR